MRLKALLRLSLALVVVLIACGRGNQRQAVDFSNETRFPDDEGVVTEIEFEKVTIDGERTHTISREVQSFSTYNGEVTALLSWKNKYVHLGLNEEDDVIWIAGIGVVIKTEKPTVVYTNAVLVRVDDKRGAIFEDGTVLKLADSVKPPKDGTRLNATIDPASHLVVAITVL